jgi:hypothetical protein
MPSELVKLASKKRTVSECHDHGACQTSCGRTYPRSVTSGGYVSILMGNMLEIHIKWMSPW